MLPKQFVYADEVIKMEKGEGNSEPVENKLSQERLKALRERLSLMREERENRDNNH